MKLKLSPKTFIYLEILFFLNKQWIIELFSLPAYISRLDFVIVLMGFLMAFPNLKKRLKRSGAKWALNWLLIFLAVVMFGWLVNGFSTVRGSWAVCSRTMGIFVFFPLCIAYLTVKDVEKIFSIMCKMQVLNVLLSFYQYFVLGIWGDYLGGIFGTVQGANGSANIFYLVLFAYLLTKTLQDYTNLKRFIFYSLSFVILAAMSDIAAFYIEMVMIAGAVFLYMRTNIKKIHFMLVGIIGFVVALISFSVIYPERFAFLMDLGNLKAYIGIGEYNGVYGISRLNPFSQINTQFFKGNIIKNLLGFGLGNCEYSEGFGALQSPFFQANRYFRYYWFSNAMTFIETGYLGLLTYFGFVTQNYISSIKFLKNKSLYEWGLYGIALIICFVFVFFYNNSLNLSGGYLMFFGLSVPYIFTKEKLLG